MVSPSVGGVVCVPEEPECSGPLAAGTHRTGEFSAPFSYTVPDGWTKGLDAPGAFNLGATAESSGFLGVWPDFGIANQSACDNDPEPGIGRTVGDLSGWLVDHPGLLGTEPAPVTVGGLAGQVIEVEKDPAWTGEPCRPDEVSLFTSKGTIDDRGHVLLGEGLRARISILDSGDDHTVVIYVEAEKAAFDSFRSMATPVVDSFTFRP